MLDECSLRRPDFLPGTRIRLADGEWWTFPGPVHPSEGVEDGARIGEHYTATVVAVAEAEDEYERLRAELALSIELLARNYRLTPAAFQELLTWAPDDPALFEMQRDFRRVASEHVRAVLAPPDHEISPMRRAGRSGEPTDQAESFVAPNHSPATSARRPGILPGL